MYMFISRYTYIYIYLTQIPLNITNIAATAHKTCNLTKRLNLFMNDKYMTFIIIRYIWFQHTIFND